jgi:superfamily I DNA/RNA helicase
MAVLYRASYIGEKVSDGLRAAGIPVQWLGGANGKRKFDPAADTVKVMTLHSSKGLEFPVVAIPAVDCMPMGNEDPKKEAKLLYVGMTRAMQMLLMTCSREAAFVEPLKRARARFAA